VSAVDISLPQFFKDTMLFLVLINPFSKVAVVPLIIERREDLRELVVKTSVYAFVILAAFAFVGDFILEHLFHIKIEALMICGGVVLFYYGFQALRRGIFFEFERGKKLVEFAVVPLVSPMIAGPATITATIYQSKLHTPIYVTTVLLVAILLNMVFMYFSQHIGSILNRYNLSGALIRIMGLFVASIGVNMVIEGIASRFPEH